jgi:hypothetical protein
VKRRAGIAAGIVTGAAITAVVLYSVARDRFSMIARRFRRGSD